MSAALTPEPPCATPVARCTCTHIELCHELFRPKGRAPYRRKCTTGTAAGPCGCPLFTPAGKDPL